MRSSLKRWTVLSLAAATVSTALVSGGCGNAEADQSVRGQHHAIAAGAAQGRRRRAQRSPANPRRAVKQADASPATKAQAKSALGQLQLEAARDTLRDSSRYEVESGGSRWKSRNSRTSSVEATASSKATRRTTRRR